MAAEVDPRGRGGQVAHEFGMLMVIGLFPLVQGASGDDKVHRPGVRVDPCRGKGLSFIVPVPQLFGLTPAGAGTDAGPPFCS